jgi:hypothetical protein
VGGTTVLGFSGAGALVACIIVGLILTPVSVVGAHPLAAIGFASVVDDPGRLPFQGGKRFLQLVDGLHTTLELLNATIADGATAAIITLAMSVGLIVPKLGIDRLAERSTKATS